MASAAKTSNRRLRVLLAPTWGKNGLLSRFGSRLICEIAKAGSELIIRPHPQTARSEPELLGRLQHETASLPNCRWDLSADPVDAMAASGILVSDISGIVFDYAFLTGRPVLTVDFPVDKRGFEAMDLPFEPWKITSLDMSGRRIGLNDIPSLPNIIEQEVSSQTRAKQIRQLRDSYELNFGHASTVAVDLIARLFGQRVQNGATAVVGFPGPTLPSTMVPASLRICTGEGSMILTTVRGVNERMHADVGGGREASYYPD